MYVPNGLGRLELRPRSPKGLLSRGGGGRTLDSPTTEVNGIGTSNRILAFLS